jgi:hypothetical protein
MTDADDSEVHELTWTAEMYHDDGAVVERQEFKVRSRREETFNSDGFWKAILLDRDGRHLRSVPLVAIEAEAEEAPPRLFIQWQDAVTDCEEVPGFV